MLLGALAVWGCGASEPGPCPMPTAEQERAAFRARAAELRERGPDVTRDEAAAGLPRPEGGLGVRVIRAGIGVGAQGGVASWSDEELERRLAETDPMQLGALLSRPDPEVIVPLGEDGSVPEDEAPAGGFLLPGLLSALQAEPALDGGEAVTLAIAPRTPFRTVAAVVYTLGQAGAMDLDFMVRSDDALHVRRFALPSLERALAAGGAELRPPLAVTLVGRGAVVSGPDGALAPGCEGPRSEPRQLTFAAGSPAVEREALQRCLRRAVEDGANPATVILSADPDVPFEHVLRAAVAAGEIFESLQLSAGVM